ncbi:hypothetical protein KY331_05520 [Candidatus Woesearchaeota archaeon]|nr:hypothetical protein [Candidatus Woesearchaeota archaeon]
MSEEKLPICCDGCVVWKTQGNKCWYFWEGKKECTQHSRKKIEQDFSTVMK